jgi:hypothetical protein
MGRSPTDIEIRPVAHTERENLPKNKSCRDLPENGRRPAKQRKMPLTTRQPVYNRHRLDRHQHQPHRRDLRGNRQCRVHCHTQRAMLFTARNLRSIRLRPNLRPMVRQPVAMDVNRLYRTRQSHQQQAGSRQQPYPERMRRGTSAALESFRQEVQNRITAQIKELFSL